MVTGGRGPGKPDVRTVMALEAPTGRVIWQKPLDVNFGAGGTLGAMYHDGALVLFNVYTDGHFWEQFFHGEFAGAPRERALRPGRAHAVVKAHRLPRPPADCRRYLARRAVGLQPLVGPTQDPSASHHRRGG